MVDKDEGLNISDDEEWKNEITETSSNNETTTSENFENNPQDKEANEKEKKKTQDEIWGEVELSDESDQEENIEKKQTKKPLELPSGLTENDIEGDFPKFKTNVDSDSESEDETPVVKEKPNPYLAHLNSNSAKYSKKLRELHLKRNEARKLNHQEVAAEDQRNKLPANYEARRKKAEWELEDQKAREAAAEAGEDYERNKMLEETADEVEIFENRKRKKKNMDPGFSDYAAAQLRQYERLTKQMKPDIVAYQDHKEKLGESAFPSAHNLMYGANGHCSEAAIDRMVGDLEKQIEKRGKFHRRRQHFDESDIDYINERNKKFNEKAERFYGEYTKEIRENLERGTAI